MPHNLCGPLPSFSQFFLTTLCLVMVYSVWGQLERVFENQVKSFTYVGICVRLIQLLVSSNKCSQSKAKIQTLSGVTKTFEMSVQILLIRRSNFQPPTLLGKLLTSSWPSWERKVTFKIDNDKTIMTIKNTYGF